MESGSEGVKNWERREGVESPLQPAVGFVSYRVSCSVRCSFIARSSVADYLIMVVIYRFSTKTYPGSFQLNAQK